MKTLSPLQDWDDDEQPWQTLTRDANLELVRRLDFKIDLPALVRDYSEVAQRFTFSTHTPGSGWECLSLVGAMGDHTEIRRLPVAYKKTSAMEYAPELERLVDSVPCEKMRVRFARLLPGRMLTWHYDAIDSLDRGLVRIHIPLITNPDMRSQLSHVDYFLKPGEAWYGDFSIPHRVFNGGDESRVHLVLEFVVNDYVRTLVGPGFDEPGRDLVRAKSQVECDKYLGAR